VSVSRTGRSEVQTRGPGRRAKLTPNVQRTICEALELGAYREVAAELAGVSRSTLFAWLSRGEEWDERQDVAPESERPYLEFLDAVRGSLAIGEHRLLGTVVAAAPKDWRAAAWALERRHPARWR
jgi:transposase